MLRFNSPRSPTGQLYTALRLCGGGFTPFARRSSEAASGWGAYAHAVIRSLREVAGAAGVNFEVTVTMKFDVYRITDEDKARFQKKHGVLVRVTPAGLITMSAWLGAPEVEDSQVLIDWCSQRLTSREHQWCARS